MKTTFELRCRFLLLVAITAAMGLMLLGGFSVLPANAQQLDEPALIQSFPVGNGPVYLAFDGANIWCTNFDDNTVTKLRASDGVIQGTFPVGDFPLFLTFDGANIWVANSSGSPTVTKLRASDGELLGTFSAGPSNPSGIAWDGANIWVTNTSVGRVTKLLGS